ncbi:hypothetical protein [Aquipuribacter nitratireducens]|uniref:DUF4276 family protein n=1 Tax=Aquipuribacter nitratireducens TaxID=650104 RepID=A0ABW0GKP7_9MICO
MTAQDDICTVASIVEGFGEVQALPKLLHRLWPTLGAPGWLHTPVPHRLPRGQIVKPERLEAAVRVQSARVQGRGGILVVVDADDDDPAELEARLAAAEATKGVRLRVVAAVPEYEAWLLAGGAADDVDPEAHRDAKSLVSSLLLDEPYRETRHQALLSQRLDVGRALSRSPSFRRLVHGLRELCSP